ncbi:MAG: octanoyltransferase [Fimbriimonadales bacterium]|nr:MAG: octanoyltransferase [Fimbriimonadales bacterium]GIV07765.1 MAG: octanoyltransferase [Fimbriimonadales bacterium]
MRASADTPTDSSTQGNRIGGNRKPAQWIDLGVIRYEPALQIQRKLHAQRVAGEIPDTLLLLEHPPVITLGKAFHPEHLRYAQEFYAQQGIELYPTDRGGDVTCHNPGQLVGYPIFDVSQHGRDLHKFLRDLETVLIRALTAFGIKAHREAGYTGVWVGNAKIAAIGIKVTKWVSMHGFALNVNNDLRLFQTIVPCGIADRPVTSLQQILGHKVPMETVRQSVLNAFEAVFGLRFAIRYNPEDTEVNRCEHT